MHPWPGNGATDLPVFIVVNGEPRVVVNLNSILISTAVLSLYWRYVAVDQKPNTEGAIEFGLLTESGDIEVCTTQHPLAQESKLSFVARIPCTLWKATVTA